MRIVARNEAGVLQEVVIKTHAEISEKEISVFKCLRLGGWVQIKEILEFTHISRRSIEFLLVRFVQLGIVTRRILHEGSMFRLQPDAEKINPEYWKQLHDAMEVYEDRWTGKE